MIAQCALLAALLGADAAAAPRPNILWITCEDTSPVLGYCGDKAAVTPNLDRLAAAGLHYTRAYSVGCVCTPARSTLITGMYASSLGSQHLRSPITLPPGVQCYAHYLRAAGYYCTNNVKQDYNFTAPEGSWDESSGKAHWRNRRPGQPFFAIFNLETTHQGKIRAADEQFAKLTARLKPEQRHDPAKTPLPPWYPDTPAVRRDMARFYDLVTAMDIRAGDLLAELDKAGVADNTIVFFFPDHGTGMPRHKRAVYESGVRVPLVIRIPPKFGQWSPGKPGSKVDRLVSFVDFAPTLLSLAGVKAPAHMQGRAFLGPAAGPEPDYVVCLRDRVDECFELSRAVCDRRFKYMRNFLPHRPYMQWSTFSEPTPTVKELRRLAAQGQLNAAQMAYLRPTKPSEELYDLQADPDELHNLAGQPEHAAVLRQMQARLRTWAVGTRDTAFLPEAELFRRAGDKPTWTMAQDPAQYPVERVFAAADLVGRPTASETQLVALTADQDAAVRYWGVVGLTVCGAKSPTVLTRLEELLDPAAEASPDVRLAAAEALCRVDRPQKAAAVFATALDDVDPRVRLAAAAILMSLEEKARPALTAIEAAAAKPARREGQPFDMYTRWALNRALQILAPGTPTITID